MNKVSSLQKITDLVGQEKIKEKLSIQISAAKKRGDCLDHILFCGDFGSGKSTFARVVACEMGVNFKAFYGNSFRNKGDFAAILTNIHAGDILIIEQFEMIHKSIVEVLFPAMEDFSLDIVIGKGSSSRSIRIKLPHFTVIGTSTTPSKVDEHLKRNMLVCKFLSYSLNELIEILMLIAKHNEIEIDQGAVILLAKSAKELPSEASRLLKHTNNYAIARSNGVITVDVVKKALEILFDYRNDIL